MNQFTIIDNSKENSEGELIIFLFELCNLNCQMCYQDHDSIIGMDTIVERFDAVSKAIDGLIAKGKTAISINLMGGELFADNIKDEIFSDYVILIQKIKSYAMEKNIPINFQIVTNLIWEKTERVKTLLDKVELPIATSWDPVGRFNTSTLKIFKKNIVEFKDYISQVGVVMTKPTIKEFLKSTPELFEYIYNNFTVVFDHYTPDGKENHIEHLLPTDVLLRDFYKFMVDNWPLCYPFSETLNNNKQPMFCMGTVNVMPENKVTSCQTYDNVKEVVVHFGKLQKHKEEWFEDYDCVSCKYMQRCSFGCFLNNHNKKSRTQKECWLKEVYDYIEER
jgi:radical SAM protein with 4Fe4S-binding SPASM domain